MAFKLHRTHEVLKTEIRTGRYLEANCCQLSLGFVTEQNNNIGSNINCNKNKITNRVEKNALTSLQLLYAYTKYTYTVSVYTALHALNRRQSYVFVLQLSVENK